MPQTPLVRRARRERPADNLRPATVISLDLARAQRTVTIRGALEAKPCGHDRHVGTCPACQRAQLARWSFQLAAARG